MFHCGLATATGRLPDVVTDGIVGHDWEGSVQNPGGPSETPDVPNPQGPDGFLFYGDNLTILRDYCQDETVDLVYLDPPFKSDQTYNVLFTERDGTQAAAQLRAFGDTWKWDKGSQAAFEEVVERGGKVSQALQAFRTFLGTTDMMAYLAMMAPRLIELRRVLKPTGSLYLHCDPTASHYLKIVLDAVFAPQNFRNEIVWRRSHPKGHAFTRFATSHDVILAYQKGDSAPTWNPVYIANPRAEDQYSLVDENGRRYQLTSLLNPNPDRPNLTYEFKGVTKVWRWTRDRMLEADRQGLIVVPKGGQGIPRFKRYLDEQEGIPVGDFWDDIPIAAGAERLGYPTQKPEALLERIIKASTDQDGVVLDPFCGCGTTIAAAHELNRKWIGIDITYAAISVIRNRFKNRFGVELSNVTGAPVTVQDAAQLAESDPYQFQWWGLDLVGARPTEQKKGADKGIDGRLYCHEFEGGPTRQVIFSVKAGTHIVPAHVSELRGVVDREKATIGVLITMHPPSKAMKVEAATAGFYQSPWGKHPRLQILTVEQLLAGEGIDYPPARQASVTYKPMPLVPGSAEQLGLFDTGRKKVPAMAKAPLFDAKQALRRRGKKGA